MGVHSFTRALFGCALLMTLGGCNTIEKYSIGGVAATLAGAQSPSHEVRQIFYVGSFDPQGQLPPELYRIRVHGQASFISNVNFQSGWVKAELVDSLATSIRIDEKTGNVKFDGAEGSTESGLKLGRRLMQFGPEGFREAPKGHRLVIVMGADPGQYFDQMNSAFAQVKKHITAQGSSSLNNVVNDELIRVNGERRELEILARRVVVGGSNP